MKWLRVLLLVPVALGGLVTPTADAPPPQRTVAETRLRPGETFEAALIRAKVGRAEASRIAAALGAEVNMRRIQPGERLQVVRGLGGRPVGLTYWRTPAERYGIEPLGDGWKVRKVPVPVVTRVAAVAGVVEGSLFAAMEQLGERAALVAKFVSLFEWDFDFAADALPGDRFRLLVEKRFVYGEFVSDGDILIAQYASAGRPTMTAAAFAVAGKTSYFDAEGRSIRKMFLRAPLEFTRITSGYTHARRHPILGGVRPHWAVDYGAPMGTPVRAVADGVVVAAGWNGSNGIRVRIRHARGYKTAYSHLSKADVRLGQRVRQHQLIGRVGSTGLSTGPHLDYRVMRDGRFVNPLDERFVPGAPVPPELRRGFREGVDALLRRLERETTPPAFPCLEPGA